MTNTVKFATFGPNRGLSLNIGAYTFIDGICEVPEQDASSASSILTRYHDVCHAYELEQKAAEYDAAQQNRTAAASSALRSEIPATSPTSQQTPATPPAPPEGGEAPQPEQNPPASETPPASGQVESPKEPNTSNSANEDDGELKKNASGNPKKPNSK